MGPLRTGQVPSAPVPLMVTSPRPATKRAPGPVPGAAGAGVAAGAAGRARAPARVRPKTTRVRPAAVLPPTATLPVRLTGLVTRPGRSATMTRATRKARV